MKAVKRNIVWLLLSQASTWLASIVLLVIVPNKLGDELFGQLSFAFVYVSFFELIAIFGTGDFLTKTIARDNDSAGRYVWNATLM
jgi:O-antigen/teichoic acid export membrane protein